jgi:uncharacterized protein
MAVISSELMRVVRAQYRLDWHGHHGVAHWARVHRHGLEIGTLVGADLRVVELFAVLHDSQRRNEGRDPDHGQRAADYAHWLNGRCFELETAAMDLLEQACRTHTGGRGPAPATVHACWDADRLDLGRVGITPDPHYLSTLPARQWPRIDAAIAWSCGVSRRAHGKAGLVEHLELRSRAAQH